MTAVSVLFTITLTLPPGYESTGSVETDSIFIGIIEVTVCSLFTPSQALMSIVQVFAT